MINKEAKSQKLGIQCRNCGRTGLRVLHTRHRNGRIDRERQCRHCKKIFWTREVLPTPQSE